MLWGAGREMTPFRHCDGRCCQVGQDRDRKLDGVLDLQLAGASVETDVIQFAALRLHRRTRRLGLRHFVTVMRRHLMLMRRRAVRTIMIRFQRHRTGLQRDVQPHGSEKPEDLPGPGPRADRALRITAQVSDSNTVFSNTIKLRYQDYW